MSIATCSAERSRRNDGTSKFGLSASAGPCRLAGRRRAGRSRAPRRGAATQLAALARGGMAFRLAATGAALLAAAALLVDGGPGATFGFLVRHTALFVALGNVVSFAILLVGVTRLVTAWHKVLRRSARAHSRHGKKHRARHLVDDVGAHADAHHLAAVARQGAQHIAIVGAQLEGGRRDIDRL